MNILSNTTKIILVRHGQSLGNLTRCFVGQGYAPLTELGHRQAQATAEFLDRYKIDVIYSSDLIRTYQTAEHTAERQKLDIIKDEGLREIFAGKWEGMPYDEISKVYPDIYNTWMTDTGNAALPGGEQVADMRDRVNSCIDKIVEQNRGGTVAVFTHATPIRVMRSVWQHEPVTRINAYGWVSNASVSEVDYHRDGSTDIIKFGYDEHLSDMLTLPNGI